MRHKLGFVLLSVSLINLTACKVDPAASTSPDDPGATSYLDACAERAQTTDYTINRAGTFQYTVSGDVTQSVTKKAYPVFLQPAQYSIHAFDDAGEDPLQIRLGVPANIASTEVAGAYTVHPSLFTTAGSSTKMGLFWWADSSPLKDYGRHGFSCGTVSGKTDCGIGTASLHDTACSFTVSSFVYLPHSDPSASHVGAYVFSGSIDCRMAKNNRAWPSGNDSIGEIRLQATFTDLCLPASDAPLIRP